MLALIDLGIAELWTARFEEAGRHLEDGISLARQLGRPYLEVTGLAYRAQLVSWRSFPLGAQRSMQAIELANLIWRRMRRKNGAAPPLASEPAEQAG